MYGDARGLPIRAFGTFSFKVSDYMSLIENIAGVREQYTVDEIRNRVVSSLDQLLMRWIVKEGKDMFNLQVNAYEIAQGIKIDLDMELCKLGLTVTDFKVESFNYPEQVQKMIDKNASYSMVGNVGHYGQVSAIESMEKNNNSPMGDMVNAGIGIQLGREIMNQVNETMQQSNQYSNTENSTSQKSEATSESGNSNIPKFCPNCGTKTNGMKFCGECGYKLI